MADPARARTVFSTATGRLCPDCGHPVERCSCRRRDAIREELPSRVVAKLRLERAGRGGKSVTVVYDLPQNHDFLASLARDLKRACGTGGSAGAGVVEIQGDQRDRVRELLRARGLVVKG